MPPARKASGQRSASGGRQATLSFNHRVTKASVPRQSAKESVLAAAEKAKKVQKTESEKEPRRRTATPESSGAKSSDEEDASVHGDVAAAAVSAAVVEPAEKTQHAEPVARSLPTSKSEAETKAESEAEAVTDTQIRRYWRSIEVQRMAPRVHQEDLDMGEKILRYFDVSSQFGPCVGITRKKRWLRAQRLGLAPPIEVMAVLLQEEAKNGQSVERAWIDGILNPTVVV